MTDPTPDTPPTLVERLRNTASYLAAGCVLPAKPYDGSDDPLDPVDDVTFEMEELRDLAGLYATAADALEEKLGEVARLGACLANELSTQAETRESLLTILGPDHEKDRDLATPVLARMAAHHAFMQKEGDKTQRETIELQTQALAMLQGRSDPPNRAPLLATLEEIAGPELASACGNGMVALIRDAIAAIRTDARVIEAAREKLKGWHDWARKLARAEGDEYASARPERLQAIIEKRLETARLGASAKDVDALGNWLVTTFQPGHVDEEAVLMPRGEYESGAAFCRRVLQLALDRGAFAVGSGRIEGLRSEEVPDQWAQIAGELWQVLAEIEGVDPWAFTTSDSLNIGYSNEVRRLAARRLHLLSAEAVVNRGPLPAVWREWACEVIGGGVDGTEAELQALIGRMLATANKLRRQNQLAFDALASGPLPMVAPSHPLDAQMATTADVAERARAAASNLRYAMGHPQESPDPTPAAMQDAVQVLTVAAAVLGATQADPSDAPRG